MKQPNWLVVEDAMLKSFRGNALSDKEKTMLEGAWKGFPKEYGRRQKRIKDTEIKRIQREGR